MHSSSNLYPTAVAPSPSQIEQPFRFLDLPAEIRIMIYEFSFERSRAVDGSDSWDCNDPFSTKCDDHRKAMKLQWKRPLLGSVNQIIRQESLTFYYATTDFDWHWDPMKVHSRNEDNPLTRPLLFLINALNYAASHNTSIKSITVQSPEHRCHPPTDSIIDIMNSVRLLGPLSKSLKQTGRAHPALRKIHFADTSALAYRLFEYAGTIEPCVLNDNKALESTLRQWLLEDPGAPALNSAIKRGEEDAIALLEEKRQNAIRLAEEETRLLEERRQETIMLHEQERQRIKMERRWKAKERRRWNGVLVGGIRKRS